MKRPLLRPRLTDPGRDLHSDGGGLDWVVVSSFTPSSLSSVSSSLASEMGLLATEEADDSSTGEDSESDSSSVEAAEGDKVGDRTMGGVMDGDSGSG